MREIETKLQEKEGQGRRRNMEGDDVGQGRLEIVGSSLRKRVRGGEE